MRQCASRGEYSILLSKSRYDLDVNAGSIPAQSTLFLSFIITLIILLNSLTAVGHSDVWCNGSTTDFDSVSCGSSPHISTNIRYGVINSKLGIVQPDESGA